MKGGEYACTILDCAFLLLFALKRQITKWVSRTVRAYQLYKAVCSEPTLSALVRIADFYGVSLDYLVGRSDDPAFTPAIRNP